MTMQNNNEENSSNSIDKKGVVYILDNEALNNWYKIGRTKHSGHKRAKQLNREAATGIPAAFFCIFQFETLDCHKAEELVHKHFDGVRIDKGEKKKKQEFFKFTASELEEAKRIITKVCIEINDEITGEAKRKERIAEAEEKRRQRKIEIAKKQAQEIEKERKQKEFEESMRRAEERRIEKMKTDEAARKARELEESLKQAQEIEKERKQKEFDESMRRAEERRIEKMKTDEAARKARELEESLKVNKNANKEKTSVNDNKNDKKDSKEQLKTKNVYCTVCGRQNRVAPYNNDKRPVCGNCKSPLWSEINRKTYTIPIDKLASNNFQYRVNEIEIENKNQNNEDEWTKYVWFGFFSFLFLVWLFSEQEKPLQKIENNSVIKKYSVVNPVVAIPSEKTIENKLETTKSDNNQSGQIWVSFDDWKKMNEEKERQQEINNQKISKKTQINRQKFIAKKKVNKTKDLRYCLEIKNVVEFDKCVNQ